jgi:hypothetical protein
MSNFAIKGHSTRGKEIIEILQMFGGINKYNITYTEDNLWYCLISKDNVIIATYPNSSIKTVLSIEEFIKKFPYQLNESVLCDNGLLGIITRMEWDCEKSDMRYHISFNTPVYNKWYYSKNIKCKFMDEKDKKLAIKGHPTRGKEVIETLEMLGGKYEDVYKGTDANWVYIINEEGFIDWDYPCDKYKVFTLEQFIEKFPYKVGDKVNYVKYNDECPSVYTIQRLRWNGVTIEYLLDSSGFSALTKDLQPYKEEIMEETIKIDIPKGYEFAGVDNQQVVFEKIGCQYPKTYEECCKILDWNHRDYDRVGYNSELLCKLQVLLLCRDAYWKIAGEQIGLGKPWNQDYDDRCFIIANNNGNIHTYEYHGSNNVILAFPTAEMRDAFYENFKELITSCKELL